MTTIPNNLLRLALLSEIRPEIEKSTENNEFKQLADSIDTLFLEVSAKRPTLLYRFMAEDEVPENFDALLHTKEGTLTYHGYLDAFSAIPEANTFNLSLNSAPSPILLSVAVSEGNRLVDLGDRWLFPRNTKFNITKVDRLNLGDREVIRLSVSPEENIPSPSFQTTPKELSVELQPPKPKRLTAEEREQIRQAHLSRAGEVFAPLFHDINTPRQETGTFSFRPRQLRPGEKYELYRVNVVHDPETDSHKIIWGYHDPRDLELLPNQNIPKVLKTHPLAAQGAEVPQDIARRIFLGDGIGDYTKLKNFSYGYVNLNGYQPTQGYAFQYGSKSPAPNTSPVSQQDVLRRAILRTAEKAVLRATKPAKTKKQLELGDRELRREVLQRFASFYPEQFPDPAKFADEKVDDPRYAHIDAAMQKALHNKEYETLPKIVLSNTTHQEEHGRWRPAKHASNTDQGKIKDKRLMMDLLEFHHEPYKGRKAARIEHILRDIHDNESFHQDRYNQAKKELQAAETVLTQFKGRDSLLLAPSGTQNFEKAVKRYREARDRFEDVSRKKDGLHILELLLKSSIRPMPSGYSGKVKEKKDVTGGARLAYRNVGLEPNDKIVLAFKQKGGSPARLVFYDHHLWEILHQKKKDLEERTRHLQNIGDLLDDKHLAYLAKRDAYLADSNDEIEKENKKIDKFNAKREAKIQEIYAKAAELQRQAAEGLGPKEQFNPEDEIAKLPAKRERKKLPDELGQLLPVEKLHQIHSQVIHPHAFAKYGTEFKADPTEVKDRLLFTHKPGDFARTLYGWQDPKDTDPRVDLSHTLHNVGLNVPENPDDGEITSYIPRKLNINLRGAIKGRLFGHAYYRDFKPDLDKGNMPSDHLLDELVDRIKAEVAQDVGHSVASEEHYMDDASVKRAILDGIEQAKRYYKAHNQHIPPIYDYVRELQKRFADVR